MRPSPSPPFSRVAIKVTDGGDTGDRGQERHRILRELQRELERHPAVRGVHGVPDERYRELRADLNPAVLGVDAADASLRIAWWPAPGEPEYAFHYSSTTGFDCGWHREQNPHVEKRLHYQERAEPDDTYEYEPVSIAAETPPRILWTVLDRLADRLSE